MRIDVIDSIEQFARLKGEWNAVFSVDPHSTIFLSWPWLHGFFLTCPSNWAVLTARRQGASSYAGFFPIARSSKRKYGLNLIRELHMGGNPLADYTGFVCSPDDEVKALEAFALYIQDNLIWDRFVMPDIFDPRLKLFLTHFPKNTVSIHEIRGTSCYYIPLPDTWENYLTMFVTHDTRKKMRRYLRKLDESNKYRVSHISQDNKDSQIETLLRLWQHRWKSQPETHLACFRSIFNHCLEAESLRLPILWYDNQPIAASALFVDQKRMALSSYISAWDVKYAKLSPGNILRTHNIRYAIEKHFEVFDFMRGSEKYKYYTFGATGQFTKTCILTRRSLRMNALNQMKKFYRSCPKTVLARSN